MAEIRWTGQAQDVRQEDTITIAGTWATSDTVSVIIGRQTLTMTVGALSGTGDVAEALSAAINAASATAGLIGTESRNFGGQEFTTFQDVQATFSGSVVTVASKIAGTPFIMTTSETAAGTAAAASSVVATGKNWVDNDDNYEAGSAPLATDTIVADSGSVGMLYGLDQLPDNVNLRRTDGYTGHIGLPALNTLGYPEYRARFLELFANAGSVLVEIGTHGSTTQSGRTYVDLGTAVNTSLRVYNAPVASSDGAAVQIVGGKALTVFAFKGTVSLGDHPIENPTEISTIETMWDGKTATASASDLHLRIGTNCTIVGTPANRLVMRGGVVETMISLTGSTASLDIHAGELVCEGGDSGLTMDDTNIYNGGKVRVKGCTNFGDLDVFEDGEFDLSRSAGGCTITSVDVFKGATWRDPNAEYVGKLDFNGCTPADVAFVVRDNQAWTASAVS